jgi:CBS domain-containing protein
MPNHGSPPPDSNLALAVKHLIKCPPLFVPPSATVAEAARAMQSARVGSVLIAADPPGIVTDRDLRGRVLAAGLGAETPVARVMSSPLTTLDSDQPAFTALRLMLEEHIHHLPLVEEGKIVGVISAGDLLLQQKSNPIYLRGVIDRMEEPAQANYGAEIGALVEELFRSGLGAAQIGQIISSLSDALVKRLVELAQARLGAPPAAYAWIVFGSEGRLEQALLTDQDNALIYAEESDAARAYFAALAQSVVNGLIQAGFPRCPGGFMATNWCKPLTEWLQLFHRWIRLPDPPALLDAAIFFDFRAVAGALSLAPLEEILSGSGAEKLFIAHMAQAALVFKPPLSFFNWIRADNGAVDLKKNGIGPVVALARAAALAAGSRERSTLERLATTGKPGSILTRADGGLLAESFHLLLRLRLRQQLTSLQAKEPLDHKINLASLSDLERRHLKEAFVTIRNIQDDVRARLHLDRMG